jgi:hypothetical protein
MKSMLDYWGALNTFVQDCGLETKLGTLTSYSLISNAIGPINIQLMTKLLYEGFSVDQFYW